VALMRMNVQMCWADVASAQEVDRALQAQQDAVSKLQAQVGYAGLSPGPSLTPRGCGCHLNLLSNFMCCVACTSPCPANLASHLSLCLNRATCRLQPIGWHADACLALDMAAQCCHCCWCTQDEEIRALQAEVARLRASQQPNVIKPKQVRTVCQGLSANTQSLRLSAPHAACEYSLVLILRAKHTAQAPAGS
jgi:hypothetical protein